jgi:hypothetical protein
LKANTNEVAVDEKQPARLLLPQMEPTAAEAVHAMTTVFEGCVFRRTECAFIVSVTYFVPICDDGQHSYVAPFVFATRAEAETHLPAALVAVAAGASPYEVEGLCGEVIELPFYTQPQGANPMATKHTDACLKKVADDEPIFVLRANDVLAPALVRSWSARARIRGTPAAKCNEADALALAMDKWQAERGSKIPD